MRALFDISWQLHTDIELTFAQSLRGLGARMGALRPLPRKRLNLDCNVGPASGELERNAMGWTKWCRCWTRAPHAAS